MPCTCTDHGITQNEITMSAVNATQYAYSFNPPACNITSSKGCIFDWKLTLKNLVDGSSIDSSIFSLSNYTLIVKGDQMTFKK